MRNITEDLRERLNAVLAEQEVARRRLADLENEATTLRFVMRQELARWDRSGKETVAGELTAPPDYEGSERVRSNNRDRSPLAIALIDILSPGNPMSLATLAEALQGRGFDFGKKSPGRTLHFALMGMRRSGIVDRAQSGEWFIPCAVEQRDRDVLVVENRDGEKEEVPQNPNFSLGP